MSQTQTLSEQLFDAGVVQFGTFTLKSGLKSPFYLDLRLLISFPELLKTAAHALAEKAKPLQFDHILGIPYAAMALATAVSLESHWPMLFLRKEAKHHGTKKMIEGHYKSGDTVLVIDDLISTGESKLEVVEHLKSEQLNVKDFLVLIDRDQGGKQFLDQKGFTLHAVLTIHDLLRDLMSVNKLSNESYQSIKTYLEK